MKVPLDEAYFRWLGVQVGRVERFSKLLAQLHSKEFVWIVPNDDNRVMDGVELRYEFCAIHAVDPSENRDWMELGCSVLEMMIGVSRRLAFETDRAPRVWFWILVNNLGIGAMGNGSYRRPLTESIVNETLDTLVWRNYQPDGVGGLFPLQDPDRNQREVEIWYQLNAYLIEQG